ncbi:Uncharacterised protein [Candidatus Bilamarchaeum dharawalense]|uniref:Uncharacterized protein n=1 Tax=Candidatus Bilamarchaeum dharawalense TaxID=2885759 RepID=A0A5E4LSD3_9ARCH|nr:Uncharacterised protein [Candidatus Bilamarchaeum dharawalense]
MRGFVITILSVSLIMILVMLAMSFRNAQLSTERALMEPLPMIYAAFLLDDIAYELNSIIGPDLYLDERNDSMIITIKDKLESYNYSPELLAYEPLLTGEIADRTASEISANFSNLTDGEITLFINDDYSYTNNHITNESIFTRDGSTGVAAYEINFTITAVRTNVTHMAFDDNGSVNVTIIYTDLNSTETEQGKILPDRVNTFKVDYVGGGSMTVIIGLKSGNSGSLSMKSTGIGAEIAWTATLPRLNATKRLGYEYDATIDYTQGPVRISKRIGK